MNTILIYNTFCVIHQVTADNTAILPWYFLLHFYFFVNVVNNLLTGVVKKQNRGSQMHVNTVSYFIRLIKIPKLSSFRVHFRSLARLDVYLKSP